MNRRTLAVILTLAAAPALGQHQHSSMDGPTETGQSAFAAIAEIVALLDNDPSTDWSEVNIPALRDHLVDMEFLTTQTVSNMSQSANTVTFSVSGPPESIGSIQRMTQAHAPMLANATGWSVTSKPMPNGAELQIRSEDQNELAKIQALGFYGVMTVGAHHQQHHLMIATGRNPH